MSPRSTLGCAAAALTLFLLLFLRIVRIAQRANDPFTGLVAFGLLASWFVHVIVNIGMTLNLMPITGIPLPFFSYGGSFMLASWLAIGVLVSALAKSSAQAVFITVFFIGRLTEPVRGASVNLSLATQAAAMFEEVVREKSAA